MLVLTRKRREGIRVGDDVIVTVLAIHGNKVQLGIEAPAEIPVHREEVFQVISGPLSHPPR